LFRFAFIIASQASTEDDQIGWNQKKKKKGNW